MLSEQLINAINSCSHSLSFIAREAKVEYGPLKRFVERKSNIHVKTAEKLIDFLGLHIFYNKKNNLYEVSLSSLLRMAIKDSKETRYKIAKNSGVNEATLKRFYTKESGLLMSSVDKLANYFCIRISFREKHE